MNSSLSKLNWLTVLVPAVFVTFFETARHLLLDDIIPMWAGSMLVLLVVSGSAFLFSRAVFAIIARQQGEILRRNQELSARNEVGIAVSEAQSLDVALGRALETVLHITGAEAGAILVLEGEGQQLGSRLHRGMAAEAFDEMNRFATGQGLPGLIAQSGDPILVADIASDPRFLRKKMSTLGFRSYAGTPLKSKNRVVGVMEVASLDPRRISNESLGLLTAIGNQIGVAIENARLMEQTRNVAILEERDRLGREIHDSFAQTLGYLNMQSRAIENLLVKGKGDQALAELKQMGEGVRGAFTDVREAISSLRTTLEPDRDILSTLHDCFKEFTRTSGVAVDLEAPKGKEIHLSPGVQVQLVRIVQEALSNTRKHARASHVLVRLEKRAGVMTLSLEDDGNGFDVSTSITGSSRHFGLAIMKERAEAVGALFSIHSEPGRGTRVAIELPGGRMA